ncbi:MAG: VWA domain-containing protein [Chitinophagales bacterium]|nr:VWA domain-containing protein [Chitinophagales bacterium]
MKKRFVFLGLQLLLFSGQAQLCEENDYRVLFVLDASHSMNQTWKNKTMWEATRRIVAKLSREIQLQYKAKVGLRVYGSRSPVSANDCEDSYLEVPIEYNSAVMIEKKLQTIKCQGQTPLTYALEQASNDLGCFSEQNILVLITDGVESCPAVNPCAIVEKLIDYRIDVKPLVFGLGLSEFELKKIDCIGEVVNIRSELDLEAELKSKFKSMLNMNRLSLNLKNPLTVNSFTDIAFSISEPNDSILMQSIHHIHKASNLPDTFTMKHVPKIKVSVATLPYETTKEFDLQGGKFHQLSMYLPINRVYIELPTFLDQKINYQILYEDQPIFFSDKRDSVFLLDGGYRMITDIPGLPFIDFQIQKGQSLTLNIKDIGAIRLYKDYKVYADIYRDQGNLERLVSLTDRNQELFYLPQGKYKVIYRSKKSFSQKSTFEKSFEIKANQIIELNL